MGDYLWTGKAPVYTTNTKVNSHLQGRQIEYLSCLTGINQGPITGVVWVVTQYDPIILSSPIRPIPLNPLTKKRMSRLESINKKQRQLAWTNG